MLAHLRIWGDQDRNGLRVVLCNWGEVPKPDEALSQVIDALARTALSLWPNWYGVQRSDSQAHPRSILASTRCAVSAPWLEAAANRCRAGKTPRLAKFANAIQAAQLALAIEPERLHIVLALSAVHSESESLLCFARAAEWLAKETQARVIAVVPSRLADFICPPKQTCLKSDIEMRDRVRQGYFQASGGRWNVRVRLADLRRALTDVPRDQLDQTLLAMERQEGLVLYPLDDPQEIHGEDEAAGLANTLGIRRHILCIER